MFSKKNLSKILSQCGDRTIYIQHDVTVITDDCQPYWRHNEAGCEAHGNQLDFTSQQIRYAETTETEKWRQLKLPKKCLSKIPVNDCLNNYDTCTGTCMHLQANDYGKNASNETCKTSQPARFLLRKQTSILELRYTNLDVSIQNPHLTDWRRCLLYLWYIVLL